MLQNLLWLWKKKTHVVFFVFHLEQIWIFPLWMPWSIHNKGKMKGALNEKRKKLHRFSFSINIAHFEAFILVFKLTKNLFFLKSVQYVNDDWYFFLLNYFAHFENYIEHCNMNARVLRRNCLIGYKKWTWGQGYIGNLKGGLLVVYNMLWMQF